MGNTLAAERAFGFSYRHIANSAYIGVGTSILHIPYITALNLAADLDTAHAFYALL